MTENRSRFVLAVPADAWRSRWWLPSPPRPPASSTLDIVAARDGDRGSSAARGEPRRPPARPSAASLVAAGPVKPDGARRCRSAA